MGKYRVCAEKGCRFKAMDSLIPSPKDYVGGRHLTLFGWTILLYREKEEHAVDLCEEHYLDQTQRPYKESYDASFNQAVDKMYDEGLI